MIQATLRDIETYAALKSWMDEKGYAPSFRQLGDILHLESTSTVHKRLQRLADMRWISYEASAARTIRIIACPPFFEEGAA